MIKIKTALIIAGVLGVLGLIPAAAMFWKMSKLEAMNLQLSGQMDIQGKHLTKSLLRASTEMATHEELSEFAAESRLDIERVRADLASLGARLEAVASTKASTTTVHHDRQPSDSSTPSETKVPICPEDGRAIDVHGYTKRIETRQIRDSNGMRVADVSFEAAEEAPWSDSVHGITFLINSTVGRTDDGRLVLHTELLATSEAEPDQTFRIEGIESRMLQVPEEARFRVWDPHVLLAIHFGIVVRPPVDLSASMNILFTVMSYGDFSFIGLGVGYDAFQNSFIASFQPFMYNIGGPIPVLSDLHVYPFVSADHNATISVGAGLGTRL